jgi:hypothetical protein
MFSLERSAKSKYELTFPNIEDEHISQYIYDSTPITVQHLAPLNMYGQLIHVLHAHASNANVSFQRWSVLGFTDPIMPNLKQLVVYPLNTTAVPVIHEARTPIKMCCPLSLEVLSMTAPSGYDARDSLVHTSDVRSILRYM